LKQLICLQDLVDLGCGMFPRASRYVVKGVELFRPRRLGKLRTTMRHLKLFAARATDRPSRVRIETLSILETALARRKGVVLWESPFGQPLLGKAALIARGYSLIQVHGPDHGGSLTWVGQQVVKPYHRRISRELVDQIVEINYQSLGYLRQIESYLKANRILCIRAFGRAGKRFITEPFRGKLAYVPTGMPSLVRRTNSSLLALFCYAEDGEDRLELVELFPLDGAEPADVTVAGIAARYLDRLGALIDRHPDQWWGMPEQPSRKNRVIQSIEGS